MSRLQTDALPLSEVEVRAILGDDSQRVGTDSDVLDAILSWYMQGCADETAGDTDRLGHAIRCGRAIVWTDSAGFTSLAIYRDTAEASHVCETLDAETFGADGEIV